eukprot:4256057-Amphidinium_carterae.1
MANYHTPATINRKMEMMTDDQRPKMRSMFLLWEEVLEFGVIDETSCCSVAEQRSTRRETRDPDSSW